MAETKEKIKKMNFWIEQKFSDLIDELIAGKHYKDRSHFFQKATLLLIEEERKLDRIKKEN